MHIHPIRGALRNLIHVHFKYSETLQKQGNETDLLTIDRVLLDQLDQLDGELQEFN